MHNKKIRQFLALLLSSVIAINAAPAMSIFAEDELLIDEDNGENLDDDEGYDDIDITPVEVAEDPEDPEDDGAEFIEDDGEDIIADGAALDDVLYQEQLDEMRRIEAEALLSDGIFLQKAQKENIEKHLTYLTSKPSPTGSDGELAMAGYIETVMEELGYTISQQDFHEGFLNENYVDVPGLNIIAERGADSDTKTSGILVFACHYDSLTNETDREILPNDKTGAAVLLEVARIIAKVESDMDVCFVFLSGEEDGLFGSENFVNNLSEEHKARIKGVFYVDTVGTKESAPYLLGTKDGILNTPARVLKSVAAEWEMRKAIEAAAASAVGAAESETEQMTEGESLERGWKVISTSDAYTEELLAKEKESENETGELSETETETEVKNPENWDLVTDIHTGGMHFSAAELPSVSLFQDVRGQYVTVSETETEEDFPPEEDTERSATLTLFDEENSVIDPDEMVKMAEILSVTAAQYMKSASY